MLTPRRSLCFNPCSAGFVSEREELAGRYGLLVTRFNPCSAGFVSERNAAVEAAVEAERFQSLFCWIRL